MKSSILAILLMSPLTLLAQDQTVHKTVSDVTDILAQKKLQNVETAKELSKLEDLANDNNCDAQMEKEQSCQGFANSLIPKGYKDKGWKTLFEIKYQPVDQTPRRSSSRANYQPIDFENNGFVTSNKEITTAAELDAEVASLMGQMQSQGWTVDPFDVRTQVILNQFTNEDIYKNLPTLAAKNDYMFNRVKEYSKSMNDQEYLRFISAIAGYVDYNDDRAAFIQKEGAGKGVVTPFEQVMGLNSGVCGDIHSMAAKMAEQRGWEAFTVGYALEGMQHVVTAMADPKNPGKLMIVNYGKYEEQDLKNGQWVNPTPTGNMQEMGMQLRIFKNDKTGDAMGKMQQIATVPTALGSFMSDLFKKEYQISKAMPQNENYRSEKLGAETSRRKVNVKKDGDKITDRIAGEGLVIYEGETDGATIYGIAVSHDVYKDIYRYDEKEGKCVLKKNKYFSVGVAGSLIDLKRAEIEDTFYAYLNMKGGQIFHIYQSERFQFKGVIGYELEGFVSKYDEGFLTADGNLSTFLGVVADYNKNGTTVHTALNYEMNVGLRNQNLMNDFSKIPSNVNPFNFNAVSLDLNVSQKLNDKTTLFTNNNMTMTRVGGRVLLSTGVIHNNTSIMASYQGGVKPLNIGNSLQTVNLLQNFNNMDGFKLTATQNFSNKKGNFSGSISGYGGISTSTPKPIPMFGAGATINLGGKKRKPAGRK